MRLTVQLWTGLGERACVQTVGLQLGVQSQPGVPEREGARRGPGPICHFYERRENKLETIHLFSPRQSFPWKGQGGAASKWSLRWDSGVAGQGSKQDRPQLGRGPHGEESGGLANPKPVGLCAKGW